MQSFHFFFFAFFFFGTKDTVISKQANMGYLEKAEQTIPGCILTWS